MNIIDWIIIALPVVICTAIAVYTRRFVRGVADFLAGGRHAGRFLISTARSEQGAGAVVFVNTFQSFAVAGFTQGWWGNLSVPVGLVVGISGFVIYRYRETRAMTLAQFFEMRYSRSFRLAAGILGFFAGLLNFGIIPVVGARFIVFFLQFPQVIHLGSFAIPTYLLLMACFLTCSVLMTTAGGQVTVLVTDCAEGIFSQLFFVFIAVALLLTYFSWAHTKAMLLDTPPGLSLVNPFDSFSIKDFNIWNTLMGLYIGTYATMAWQNSQAFNSSAATAHESRMGGILGRWRSFAGGAMITILAMCAMTYLKSPQGAIVVKHALNMVPNANTQSQMRIPLALSYLLPVGVKGALAAICLMGIVSGDGIHLHSWGSILVQDVILPMRKTQVSTRTHLLLLRGSIVLVAVFAFFFEALFSQTEYVAMWFSVTQAVFTGGAGAAIIGGLYWKRGTSAGAWTGMALGCLLTLVGMTLRIYFVQHLNRQFPLNGVQVGFFSTLIAMTGYIVVSYLTCKEPHNMDKLLNRGIYAIKSEEVKQQARTVSWIYRIMGIDDEFSRSDRWITVGIFCWSMFWVLVFVLGSIIYLIHPWSNGAWAEYHLWSAIYLPVAIGVVTTVWFTIGGLHDMRVFFRRLQTERQNPQDDGTVAEH